MCSDVHEQGGQRDAGALEESDWERKDITGTNGDLSCTLCFVSTEVLAERWGGNQLYHF